MVKSQNIHRVNLPFDMDADSTSSLQNLIKASLQSKLTLVCGAGVSVSAKLPAWGKFLYHIINAFIRHWKFEEKMNKKFLTMVPRGMSINSVSTGDDLSSDITDRFFGVMPTTSDEVNKFCNEDPLVIAQMIKNCIEPADWKWMLRKALYGSDEKTCFRSDLISAICDLVESNEALFTSILTYNYDDLIEDEFASRGFQTTSVIQESRNLILKNFPVFHMHGILPRRGGLDGKVYLTEEDYLADIIEPNSWYNLMHCNKLTSTVCIFVGLSFNDPSVKRKLAINRTQKNHFHYAFLTHEDDDMARRKFLLLKNELLRLNVRVIKYPFSSDHSQLRVLVKYMNDQLAENGQ